MLDTQYIKQVSIPWIACLQTSVLKSLTRVLSVYYYIISIVAGKITECLIWAPRFGRVDGGTNLLRVCAYCGEEVATGIVLIGCLPLLDAVPSRVAAPRTRLLVFSFVTIYNLMKYVNLKRRTAELYASGDVPELMVDGFVELSSLGVLCKSSTHTCACTGTPVLSTSRFFLFCMHVCACGSTHPVVQVSPSACYHCTACTSTPPMD